MGKVYKARDTRLNRTVAIKVSNEKFSGRFEREARAVAALNHPHICTLYDIGPDYLVMEYIEGHPLEGPLPLTSALRYGIEIADALDAAHRRGIVHRDLKPANILVANSGVKGVKLVDFGLARAPVSEDDTLTITHNNTIVGTPQYMSPEQWEGKEADARSDIFAFGAILYELVTGTRLFPGRTTATAPNPKPASAINPEVPAALDHVIERCLARDPDERWQSARDIANELHWVAQTGAQSQPAVHHRKQIAWTAIAIALLVIIAVGGLVLNRRSAPERRLADVSSPVAREGGVALVRLPGDIAGRRSNRLHRHDRRSQEHAVGALAGFGRYSRPGRTGISGSDVRDTPSSFLVARQPQARLLCEQ